ncbi:TPA: Rsd/AlgQ family anti-sigma factor [Escherichia coli]|nr:Rsd/AlgQ family anti-sigma factor [Escherichia coli]
MAATRSQYSTDYGLLRFQSGNRHYERILHKLEGNGQLARAAKIWPQLEANTQQIMDYYDSSLETAIDHDNYLEFQQVLSDIGEALEARFVLEDKLILLVLDAARVKHPA